MICCMPEEGDTKVFWWKVGRVMEQRTGAAPEGWALLDARYWYLTWALSWALAHSSAPGPGEELSELLTPHRAEGVHSYLHSHTFTDQALCVLLLSRLSQLKKTLTGALNPTNVHLQWQNYRWRPWGCSFTCGMSLGHSNVQKWLYSYCKKEDQGKNNTKNCHTQKRIQQ